jgi:ABC-type transport system involved in multi-copper enzyme maturation permease subunit
MSILNIARFTFREARRRRLLWLGIGLGLAFLLLFTLLFYLVYDEIRGAALLHIAGDEARKAMLSLTANFFLMMGLFAVNFLVVLVAILTTVSTVSNEIESHTIQAIATKSLRRWEIILGKWLGHALMVSFYILLLTGGIIFSVYVVSGHSPRQVAGGLGLFVLEGIVLMTVSITVGTRLSTLANGVTLFMVYGLAFIGGWVEQFISLPGIHSDLGLTLSRLAGRLLPSEVLWRRASHIMAPNISSGLLGEGKGPPAFLFTFGHAPEASIVLYALAYIAVMLLLAMWSFRQRDL